MNGLDKQVLTIEYLVPGELDGVTPSPEFSIDQNDPDAKRPDSDGVYRFSAEEMLASTGGNLGLIDLTGDFGDSNLLANRLVTWFYLDAPGNPGGVGASLEAVNLRDDSIDTQLLLTSLVGRERFFGGGFFVPQASRMRLRGYAAGPEPTLVRFNVGFFETVEDLLAAISTLDFDAATFAQFSGYLSALVPIPGAALTPMPIDSLNFAFDPSVYEHVLGSSDVRVLKDGRYRIVAQASIDNTLGAARTSSAMALFVDSGAGFLFIPGSIAYGYHRNATNGEDTLPVNEIVNLSAGDVVRCAAIRIAGTGPLSYLPSACRFSITKLPQI